MLQYTRTSSIPVRLVQIKWFNDAVVLYFKFDLLKDPNLNSDMRKSFAPVLNGGRLKIEDESGNQKDCLPSELLLSFHTEPSSDVGTEIFISMAPDYLRVFRDPRISDDAQPQNLAWKCQHGSARVSFSSQHFVHKDASIEGRVS